VNLTAKEFMKIGRHLAFNVLSQKAEKNTWQIASSLPLSL